jgi:ribose 5-phosphate isomerase A
MTRDDKKRAAARAALDLIGEGSVIGVGTGSTAGHFIDALASCKGRLAGAVASSRASAERLERAGIPLLELADVAELPLYVDGADEATRRRQLIKGGGGALTREKIVAGASRSFACIIDDGKLVTRLGAFPLAVEVIPMARRLVEQRLAALGGEAALREGFVTDNGNVILDVRGLPLDDPLAVEDELDRIPGVVANGLFCRRPADLLVVGTDRGVEWVPPAGRPDGLD